MVLDKSTLLRYYKRKEVQDALVAQAQGKEIGFRYGDGFGKRPDVLTYPRDVLEVVMRGATSFHASEEVWSNPLLISSDMGRKQLDEVRSGWDLVLDIDCAVVEYSKICAELIVAFLKYCDCDSFAIKFSGNKGFHIGIPFEAFPVRIGDVETRLLFPTAPKKIAFYVKENIKVGLARKIMELENGDISRVATRVGLLTSDIIRYELNKDGLRVGSLDVEKFLEIDTVLLSSRHLYRMAYSLHEKSGLVSLPLRVDQLKNFVRDDARIELLGSDLVPFLSRNVGADSARRLLTQALDFELKVSFDALDEKRAQDKKTEKEIVLVGAIPKEYFPPCMQKIEAGLVDGKKRALFCAMHFLGKIGWSREQIDAWVSEWNSRSSEPLREVYLKGQFAHFVPGERLCPNCDNESYYKGIGVCHPDAFCRRIKNPANYTLLKFRGAEEQRVLDEKAVQKEGRRLKKEALQVAKSEKIKLDRIKAEEASSVNGGASVKDKMESD